ncbi:helicase C-terminal domain-containing protein [Opitutus sp. GAS368]|uniref:ATP-dependent DNA helicase n=1 Tax=Opitutus sp. GAS368 TaxID=1882749 RepID=UPI00087A0842|nr:helicase C-terminal domain-containing protein [Opitutus sp. GAS368]SDS60979.1 ATP-dependent DNA helicase DinG [Opitutus sp. GAS368]
MIGLNDDGSTATAGGPKPSRMRKLAAGVFAETGALCDALNLEHRPEQEQMACFVAGSLHRDEPLLFEAGTGVGKSLAYLIPGLIHAVDQGRQLIVSTHTISLQEQIEQKDLPICRRVFKSSPNLARYADFRSTVLVGKANYLCPTRLGHALADRASLFADADYEELQRIAGWADTTTTGLRHELKPPPRPEVWDAVNADSSACSRKHCDDTKCHYQRARVRLRTAQVIIVNHALLFALINAGGAQAHGATTDVRGVLFPDDFLVLDEAHTVPDVATDNFGLSLSSYGLDRALKYLFNPRTKRGLFRKHGGAAAQQLVFDALEASQQFFGFLATRLLEQRAIVRVRETGVAEPMLDGPLGALHRLLGALADKLEDGRERDELLEQQQRIKGLQAGLTEWLTLGDKGHVYWVERGGRKQTIVTLRSAPIDVAPELRKHLFGCRTSVVCTSATLAMGASIEPFARRIGADTAEAVAVKSPFDFERNMRVFVATDVPLPSPQEAKLALETLADYIRFCTAKVRGGSLVLFTSYTDMRAVAAELEPGWRAAGRPFLIQGADLSRTELAHQMRTLGNAVLFGTDSFWTGVDVPGAALSQVIITRLPFDPPTHPITEAKCERIRDAGGNPFNELTLPDALIKFRQGVGRLIRNKTDRGTVTILDSRVLAKTYGREFLGSLPTEGYERMDRSDRERIFRPFP